MDPAPKTDEEIQAEIAARTRVWSGDPTIEFYRQPGGCLEINEFDVPTHLQWTEQDCVHICGDQIEKFIADLQAFVREVPGEEGS